MPQLLQQCNLHRSNFCVHLLPSMIGNKWNTYIRLQQYLNFEPTEMNWTNWTKSSTRPIAEKGMITSFCWWKVNLSCSNDRVFLLMKGKCVRSKMITHFCWWKVITSGPNDHVFVNFADHGAPGLIAFPHEVLHVAQLNKTIWKMYEDKKYHKMVINWQFGKRL